MATIVETIDAITAWIQTNVCDHFHLKRPDDEETATGEVVLVTPRAFAMYLPVDDEMAPPDAPATHPSALVQLMKGVDVKPGSRSLNVRVSFTTFSIGTQQGELLVPSGGSANLDKNEISEPFTLIPEAEWTTPPYRRNEEGWRDAWNMIDRALREIENSKQIATLQLDREKGVEFGPYANDDTLWWAYPYWSGWVSFTLTGDPTPNTWEIMQKL